MRLCSKVAGCPTCLRITCASKDGTIGQREVHTFQFGLISARARTASTCVVRNSIWSTCFIVNGTTCKVRTFRGVVVVIGFYDDSLFSACCT